MLLEAVDDAVIVVLDALLEAGLPAPCPTLCPLEELAVTEVLPPAPVGGSKHVPVSMSHKRAPLQ